MSISIDPCWSSVELMLARVGIAETIGTAQRFYDDYH